MADGTGGLEGCRVLVVEDEAMVAMLVEDILADAGCRVIGPAPNAEEALRLVREAAPDAASLDINLGSGEVYPVAEELASRGVPFVLVSGYDRENVLARYRRWPILQKPFTPEGLVAALRRVLAA